MLVQLVYIYPSRDNVPAARGVILDRAKSNKLNATGGVTQVIIGEVPTIVTSMIFENMKAFETFREQNAADPEFQEYLAKLGPVTRKPTELKLAEVIIRPPTPQAGKYIHRAEFYPAPGKQSEVLSTLEQIVDREKEAGMSVSLARQLFSPHGSVFNLHVTYDTLTEYEGLISARRERIGDLLNQAEANCRVPYVQELREKVL